MKTFAFFLVILCSTAYSSATLLKPKGRIFPLVRPATRYRPVNYVEAPVVVSKPVAVPAAYVQPAPIVTTHVSTYSAAVPTYTAPVTAYALPVPSYEVSTFSVPASTYGIPYDSTAVTYGPPELGWTGAVPTFDEPIYENYWRYSSYAKSYKY